MVHAVLIILGLFVVLSVLYNFFSLQRSNSSFTENKLFSGSSKVEIMKPSVEEINLEPVIDISLHETASLSANAEEERNQEERFEGSEDPEESTLVSIYVMRKTAGQFFNPYELLQSLAAVNCHFGEMSIFHRHEQANGEGEIVFSIAQAVKPGIFKLSDIGSIKCPGLLLFMDAVMMDDPYFVFNQMLETAEQLAQDLQAELCQTPTEPLTERSQAYYERKLNYAKRERQRLKEMV